MDRLTRNASGAISNTARTKGAGGMRAISPVKMAPHYRSDRVACPNTKADISSSSNYATQRDGKEGSHCEAAGKPLRVEARVVEHSSIIGLWVLSPGRNGPNRDRH